MEKNTHKQIERLIDYVTLKQDITNNIRTELEKIVQAARKLPDVVLNPYTADTFYPMSINSKEITKSLLKNSHSYIKSIKQETIPPISSIELQLIEYIKNIENQNVEKTIDNNIGKTFDNIEKK